MPVTWTRPTVASQKTVTIRVTCTFYGHGITADDGTTATATDTFDTTVLPPGPAIEIPEAKLAGVFPSGSATLSRRTPPAIAFGGIGQFTFPAGSATLTIPPKAVVAPSVSIFPVTAGRAHEPITLQPLIDGGRYDSLVYAWITDDGYIFGPSSIAPTFWRGDGSQNATIRLQVTAIGMGTNALSGSQATVVADPVTAIIEAVQDQPDSWAVSIPQLRYRQTSFGKSYVFQAGIRPQVPTQLENADGDDAYLERITIRLDPPDRFILHFESATGSINTDSIRLADDFETSGRIRIEAMGQEGIHTFPIAFQLDASELGAPDRTEPYRWDVPLRRQSSFRDFRALLGTPSASQRSARLIFSIPTTATPIAITGKLASTFPAGSATLSASTPPDIAVSGAGAFTFPDGEAALTSSGQPVFWLSGSRPDGIYKSTDGGANWSSRIDPPSGQTDVTGVAVDPRNGDVWLAGSVPNGIYKSTDGGATWGSLIEPPDGQTYVTGVAVDPRNGDVWLAGRIPNGIYKSTDGGANWGSLLALPSDLGQTGVAGVAVDPRNGDVWLCGRRPNSAYKSTDGGATWDASFLALAGTGNFEGIAVDARTGDIWAATSRAVHRFIVEFGFFDFPISIPSEQLYITGFHVALPPQYVSVAGKLAATFPAGSATLTRVEPPDTIAFAGKLSAVFPASRATLTARTPPAITVSGIGQFTFPAGTATLTRVAQGNIAIAGRLSSTFPAGSAAISVHRPPNILFGGVFQGFFGLQGNLPAGLLPVSATLAGGQRGFTGLFPRGIETVYGFDVFAFVNRAYSTFIINPGIAIRQNVVREANLRITNNFGALVYDGPIPSQNQFTLTLDSTAGTNLRDATTGLVFTFYSALAQPITLTVIPSVAVAGKLSSAFPAGSATLTARTPPAIAVSGAGEFTFPDGSATLSRVVRDSVAFAGKLSSTFPAGSATLTARTPPAIAIGGIGTFVFPSSQTFLHVVRPRSIAVVGKLSAAFPPGAATLTARTPPDIAVSGVGAFAFPAGSATLTRVAQGNIAIGGKLSSPFPAGSATLIATRPPAIAIAGKLSGQFRVRPRGARLRATRAPDIEFGGVGQFTFPDGAATLTRVEQGDIAIAGRLAATFPAGSATLSARTPPAIALSGAGDFTFPAGAATLTRIAAIRITGKLSAVFPAGAATLTATRPAVVALGGVGQFTFPDGSATLSRVAASDITFAGKLAATFPDGSATLTIRQPPAIAVSGVGQFTFSDGSATLTRVEQGMIAIAGRLASTFPAGSATLVAVSPPAIAIAGKLAGEFRVRPRLPVLIATTPSSISLGGVGQFTLPAGSATLTRVPRGEIAIAGKLSAEFPAGSATLTAVKPPAIAISGVGEFAFPAGAATLTAISPQDIALGGIGQFTFPDGSATLTRVEQGDIAIAGKLSTVFPAGSATLSARTPPDVAVSGVGAFTFPAGSATLTRIAAIRITGKLSAVFPAGSATLSARTPPDIAVSGAGAFTFPAGSATLTRVVRDSIAVAGKLSSAFPAGSATLTARTPPAIAVSGVGAFAFAAGSATLTRVAQGNIAFGGLLQGTFPDGEATLIATSPPAIAIAGKFAGEFRIRPRLPELIATTPANISLGGVGQFTFPAGSATLTRVPRGEIAIGGKLSSAFPAGSATLTARTPPAIAVSGVGDFTFPSGSATLSRVVRVSIAIAGKLSAMLPAGEATLTRSRPQQAVQQTIDLVVSSKSDGIAILFTSDFQRVKLDDGFAPVDDDNNALRREFLSIVLFETGAIEWGVLDKDRGTPADGLNREARYSTGLLNFIAGGITYPAEGPGDQDPNNTYYWVPSNAESLQTLYGRLSRAGRGGISQLQLRLEIIPAKPLGTIVFPGASGTVNPIALTKAAVSAPQDLSVAWPGSSGAYTLNLIKHNLLPSGSITFPGTTSEILVSKITARFIGLVVEADFPGRKGSLTASVRIGSVGGPHALAMAWPGAAGGIVTARVTRTGPITKAIAVTFPGAVGSYALNIGQNSLPSAPVNLKFASSAGVDVLTWSAGERGWDSVDHVFVEVTEDDGETWSLVDSALPHLNGQAEIRDPTLQWHTYESVPDMTPASPILLHVRRKTEGQPAIGEAVSSAWGAPFIGGRFGREGDTGAPGYGATILYNELRDASEEVMGKGQYKIRSLGAPMGGTTWALAKSARSLQFHRRDLSNKDHHFFLSSVFAGDHIVLHYGYRSWIAFEVTSRSLDAMEMVHTLNVMPIVNEFREQGDEDSLVGKTCAVRFSRNDPFTSRVTPVWVTVQISALLATQLANVSKDDPLPAAAALVANAAVPGGRPINADSVILYRGSFSIMRSWNGITEQWVAVEQIINGNLLVNGTILAHHLAANIIDASKIAVGSITADELAEGSVGADQVIAGAIETDHLGANIVTAEKIAAGVLPDVSDFITAASLSGLAKESQLKGIDYGTLSNKPTLVKAFADLEGLINSADIAAGVIVAAHMAAASINLGSAVVFGTLTAAHIDSDVPNSVVIFDTPTNLPEDTTVSLTLLDDVRKWQSLIFTIQLPFGSANKPFTTGSCPADSIPETATPTIVFGFLAAPHENRSNEDNAPVFAVGRSADGKTLYVRETGQWRPSAHMQVHRIVAIKHPETATPTPGPTPTPTPTPTPGGTTTVMASAGADVEIDDDTDTDTYTLQGSATVQNGVGDTTYKWTFVGGATQNGYTASLSDDTILQPVLTLPNLPNATTRTWTLRLTVTNNEVSDSDDVVIMLVDKTPAATTPPPLPINVAAGPPRNPSGGTVFDSMLGQSDYILIWNAPTTGGRPSLYRYRLAGDTETRTTTITNAIWRTNRSGVRSFEVRAENSIGESAWVTGSITPPS